MNLPRTNSAATVTILEDGVRSNGSGEALAERPLILAVGDSFTFGDQVSDDQTWPAALERILQVRVLNAGVYAFGLDQSVLRAESLARTYEPDLVVLSFIADDVRRTQISVRADSASKPFFVVDGDGLVLHNDPVPPPKAGMDPIRRVLGYSHLADAIFRRLAPAYWLAGPNTQVHERGPEVACLLMERLARLRDTLAVPVLVVSQAEHGAGRAPALTEGVLACADAQGLETLALHAELAELARSEPRRYASLFFGHMTEAGNRFVAERIAAVAEALLER